MSCCSCGRPSQRADAPLAIISVWACNWCLPRWSRNGRWLRSALVRWPTLYSAPKRSACLRMFSTSCGPRMPSGSPGKFSTSVVRASCPPGSCPSTTSGFKLARAAYSAAVCPEHPEPIMTTSRVSLMDCFVLVAFRLQISDFDARHRFKPERESAASRYQFIRTNLSPHHFLSSLLVFKRPTHHGSGRGLSLWTARNLRQFVGNSSFYTQQVAIVREHLGSATEQGLIRALIRSRPFGSQAAGPRH